MKKLVPILTILVSGILNSSAQSNGGFEFWHSEFSYLVPDSWQTLNILSIFTPPNPISAFKATGLDAHSGVAALKLKTIFVNNNPYPIGINDTIGYVFTGKVVVSPPSLKIGMPYTERPEKFEFWAKYIPVGGDIAAVTVILQKWNGSRTDTIARCDIKIDSTVLSYAFFQTYLNYFSTALPDTIIIGFSSSYKKSIARVGSSLYLDDVALTGWVGIEETNPYINKIKIFPNPAKDNVIILAQIDEAAKVKVSDATGKQMAEYKIQNYSANISTVFFSEGIYFYAIRDKKDRILSKGKFTVVK